MKKLLVLIAAMAFVALGAGMAKAGEYHVGVTLICSDCHIMHASMTHDYSGPASSFTPTGAYPSLLKGATPNDTCLACHDGQTSAPDVLGVNTLGNVRQAGALNKIGGAGTNYEEFKGHTLGAGISTDPPGGTWPTGSDHATGLECTHCHSAHASGSNQGTDVGGAAVTSTYRNLVARPGFSHGGTTPQVPVSYAKTTNDTTKDVFLRGWTLGQVSNNYDIANVDFNRPSATASGTGRWCAACHGNFHGGAVTDTTTVGDGTEFVRHPTSTVTIAGAGSTFTARLLRVKVMSSVGDWGTQGTALGSGFTTANMSPSCFSCHKSHGNQNPFGLIYLKGLATGTITEEGDAAGNNLAFGAGGGMRSLCKQCHSMGGTN
jgi:hypothetical protein